MTLKNQETINDNETVDEDWLNTPIYRMAAWSLRDTNYLSPVINKQ